MTSDDAMDEFLADFGSRPASEQDLDNLLGRARQSEDAVLRLAVKELRTLRWLGRMLLERVEQQPVAADDHVVRLARFLLRGDKGDPTPA